jgi:folate-dependent phosphoribosylglycinamide formyltransferase PurN
MLLGGGSASTRIVYHHLAKEYDDLTAVIEGRVSRKAMMRARITRIGLLAVASQMAFMIAIRPVLSKLGAARISEIKTLNCLDDGPIPASAMFMVPSVNDREALGIIASLAPRVIIVNGTRIIRRPVLESTNAIFLNTHVGITPRYRGAHGAYWALLNNDPEHCGITVHVVDEGIDTGAIVAQAKIAPTRRDNFVTYPYLQIAAALPMLSQAVRDALAGNLRPRAGQGPSAIWYHPGFFQYLLGAARGVK